MYELNLTPEDWEASALLDEIVDLLSKGTPEDFTKIQERIPSFPMGIDPFFERAWLTHAIEICAITAIDWIIDQRADINYRDGEGYTPLMSTIELADSESKYQILESLLQAGADPDHLGHYGTAAHLAAMRGDLQALKILKRFGANLCLPYMDLGIYTPLDHAIRLNRTEVAEFLKSACNG